MRLPSLEDAVHATANQRRFRQIIPLALIAFSLTACRAPRIKSTADGPLSKDQLAQLWTQPESRRDLFLGVGGARLAPDPSAKYTVIEIKRGGFSRGYTVTGPGDREWSVKFPPEAGTEVIASRIHWGIGYHQPPIYLLPEWTAEKATSPNPQLPARFREKDPDLNGLEAGDPWSYYQNPFVGTRQLNGLLVLQAMLGNSDLKDEQNVIYSLARESEGSKRWYVARDLGHTFGRTGVIDAPRGDIEAFEKTPFIRGVEGGRVRFEYRGRHKALFDDIAPADVRWVCERLETLSDQQWHDAFRAGGVDRQMADRFIRRMKQKIAEGLALRDR
jgi:hypothetical protein